MTDSILIKADALNFGNTLSITFNGSSIGHIEAIQTAIKTIPGVAVTSNLRTVYCNYIENRIAGEFLIAYLATQFQKLGLQVGEATANEWFKAFVPSAQYPQDPSILDFFKVEFLIGDTLPSAIVFDQDFEDIYKELTVVATMNALSQIEIAFTGKANLELIKEIQNYLASQLYSVTPIESALVSQNLFISVSDDVSDDVCEAFDSLIKLLIKSGLSEVEKLIRMDFEEDGYTQSLPVEQFTLLKVTVNYPH